MTEELRKSAPEYLIGVDIGGTGVKGGIVRIATGELYGERYRLDTPRPSTPDATREVISAIVQELIGRAPEMLSGLPLGIDYPGVVRRGTAESAANVDPSWIGVDVEELVGGSLGLQVKAINDADAAGLAESSYGGAARKGLTIVVTLGTGIGSAFVYNKVVLPNTELGHLEFHGGDAEKYASASAREHADLSWPDYAKRLQEYFNYLERIFSPDAFIVGGGISRRANDFLPLLELSTPISTATLMNNAGIVGSALYAAQNFYPEKYGV